MSDQGRSAASELVSIPSARVLLSKYGLWPRRSLGQNFLVDPSAPSRIADCADLAPDDTVVEVGAGLGTLTVELANRARRVVAVETDPNLVDVLESELGHVEQVEVIHGDILTLDPASLVGMPGEPVGGAIPLWGPRREDYCVVANLPYYITAAVVRHLLEASVRPRRMVVTVQLEVAQRMVARPGDMSLLSVSTQFYSSPRIRLRLKRGAFHPAPKVASAVVSMELFEEMPVEIGDVAVYFSVVRAGFSQRRKQLRNSLAAGLSLAPDLVASALHDVGLDHTRRAETLSVVEWGSATQAMSHLMA